MGIIISSAGGTYNLSGHGPPDHQRKLQNLMVCGTSKNELAVEGTNNGTTRTADTTTGTHKTFESANNSNSVKGSAAHLNQHQGGKIATIFPQKPPRDHSINRNRPSTTASSSTAFRFYHYQQQ